MRKKTDLSTKILEAFLSVCQEEGIENVTLQKIASQSGASLGAVHSYFGPKTGGLTLAAARHVASHAQKYIEEKLNEAMLDPKSKLVRVYIEGTFEWARKFPTYFSFWVYYYHLCSTGLDLRNENKKALKVARARMRSLIYDGVGKRQIAAPSNIEQLSTTLHFILVGGLFVALADSTPGAFAAQLKAVLHATDKMML